MPREGFRVLPGMVQDFHGVGGRQLQLCESPLDDSTGKLVGGPLGVRRADDRVAEHEIWESAVDAGIEGRRGEEAGAAVALFERHVGEPVGEMIGEGGLPDHHALGLSGGAGGVDDVGRAVEGGEGCELAR